MPDGGTSRRAHGGPRGPRSEGPPPTARTGFISIGALARASGVPIETLRTWERRYGFPTPVRTASGHRRFPIGEVARLQQIARAIALGHRVSDVIHAPEEDLRILAGAAPALPDLPPVAAGPASRQDAELVAVDVPGELEACLEEVRRFDTSALTRRLLSVWARLGPVGFADRFAGPLLGRTGAAWESGELEIRHEHFLSERLGDVLRSIRLPLEERAAGPIVILATLPGEAHGLGLEMAAVILAHAGWRTLYLGTQVPIEQIRELAHEHRARAVGLSVSAHAPGVEPLPSPGEQIHALRRLLPAGTALLAGGGGAEALPGVALFRDLGSLELWARREMAQPTPPRP